MPAGRPTDYSEEAAEELLVWMRAGGSVASYCECADTPSHNTIIQWKKKFPEFDERYARACIERATAHAEEILEIADNEQGDTIAGEKGMVGNPVKVARDRLRIDSRKWLMSKMLPKTFGDRVGAVDENTSTHVLTIEIVGGHRRELRDNPDDVPPEFDGNDPLPR